MIQNQLNFSEPVISPVSRFQAFLRKNLPIKAQKAIIDDFLLGGVISGYF